MHTNTPPKLSDFLEVRIGHETWKLNWVPSNTLPDCEGFCEYPHRSLTLAKDRQVTSRAGTAIHELLHALWASWNLPEANEELVVSTLSNGLASLIQDNPKLFETILKDLRRDA
jgi:hypothetical protein